jgi:hypothetical protein
MRVTLKSLLAGLLLAAGHVNTLPSLDISGFADGCEVAPLGILNPSSPNNLDLTQILARNQAWAKGVEEGSPGFFNYSGSHPQTPQIGWFGCSDSREPETSFLNFRPGEVFGISLYQG